MRLYKISERDVMSAVESPDFSINVSTKEKNRMVAMKKFRDKIFGVICLKWSMRK
jgi:hypothetical protein